MNDRPALIKYEKVTNFTADFYLLKVVLKRIPGPSFCARITTPNNVLSQSGNSYSDICLDPFENCSHLQNVAVLKKYLKNSDPQNSMIVVNLPSFQHILCTRYCILSTSHTLFHLILPIALWGIILILQIRRLRG